MRPTLLFDRDSSRASRLIPAIELAWQTGQTEHLGRMDPLGIGSCTHWNWNCTLASTREPSCIRRSLGWLVCGTNPRRVSIVFITRWNDIASPNCNRRLCQPWRL